MGEYYIKFIIVKLEKHEKEFSFMERVVRRCRLRNKERLLQKPLFTQRDCVVMGRHGMEVELPFSKNDILNLEPAYLEAYIRNVLDIYDIPGCYLDRELSFLNDRFHFCKKWIFSHLLFEKGLELFLKQCKISKKDARFVVIDSENQKIEMILQKILVYANYLTIVTERSEYFRKAIDIIYEETGLMVDVISVADKKIAGNVIINLDRDRYQLYTCFEEGALVVDLAFTNKKLEYLANRKKKLQILFDYEITAEGEKLDQELMAEVMVRDNWKVSRFAKRAETVLSPEEIDAILNAYEIEIEKLMIVSY